MRAPFLLPTASQAPVPFRDPRLPPLRGKPHSWPRVLELGVAGVSTVMLPVCGYRFTRQHSFPSFLWLRLSIAVLLSSVQKKAVYRLPEGGGLLLLSSRTVR